MDGYAAIDKLSDAGVLNYSEEDQQVHLNPRKARALYQYLRRLREILRRGIEETLLEGAELKVVR